MTPAAKRTRGFASQWATRAIPDKVLRKERKLMLMKRKVSSSSLAFVAARRNVKRVKSAATTACPARAKAKLVAQAGTQIKDFSVGRDLLLYPYLEVSGTV